MKTFEETLANNTPYQGYITNYDLVEYDVLGEKICFGTETLRRDLQLQGYDDMHISLILQAIHNSDGAIHQRIKVQENS